MSSKQKLLFCLALCISAACKDNGISVSDDSPCESIDPSVVPETPFDSPIWHPSDGFIGFNHTPLLRIDYPFGQTCRGEQHFNGDSAGFWRVNPDGSNKRRIFPYRLQSPQWSPDGTWIVFVLGAQIFKMQFTGTNFDTTTLTQLTTDGSNFYPAWSPDGEWIAYNRSICDGPNTCGIWLMSASGTQHQFLAAYGNFPTWHPFGRKVLYETRAISNTGIAFGDSVWIFDVQTNSRSFFFFLGGGNFDNRFIRYSPDGTQIAFWSNGNLWMVDSSISNPLQITSEGVDATFGLPFSWRPTQRTIVFTRYHSNNWTYENGDLWIVNGLSGAKTQLTINSQPPH